MTAPETYTLELEDISCPHCGSDGYGVEITINGGPTEWIFACDDCSLPIMVEVDVTVR